MTVRLFVALISSAALVAAGCDSDGSAQPDPTVEADTTEAPDDTTAPTTEADTAEATEQPEVVDPGPTYPEGPYGTGYLDTVRPDMGFYDPWTGLTHKVSDYYQKEGVKVLLMTSAAGWCNPCMYEGWDLVTAYDKYKDFGLEILFTMFEDANYKSLWRPVADAEEIDRDFTFMNAWRDNLGVRIGLEKRTANYPLLVDIGHQLDAYQPDPQRPATPVTVMVRTKDMKIIYVEAGYASGTIEHHIKTQLFASTNQ